MAGRGLVDARAVRMIPLLRSAAVTARAAAIVCAAAGLVEGILLAVVYDPFGAGWGARVVSILTFVTAYLVVGSVAGALLGFLLHIMRLGRAVPAVACGLIGLFHLTGWARALGEIPGLIHLPVALVAISGAILFALSGLALSRPVTPRRRGAPAVAAGAGLFLVAASALPVTVPDPSPPDDPSPARLEPVDLAPARHLLFIVADTLRADHLSLYGYQRLTSPALDRFARTGVVFNQAFTPKTKTSPSVASLLTGTYPQTHGLVNCRTRLPDEAVTLAEVLRDRRYATHSIVANGNIGAAFNFDQGFESVDEIWSDPNQSDARGVTDHALKWLDALAAGDTRPFFLYVHYVDPHAPYAPPPPWTDKFMNDALYGQLSHLKVEPGDGAVGSIRPSVLLPDRPTDIDYYVARYDAEIAYLDHHLERLLEGLRQRGLDRDTLVIFTSDHGEALWEHDVYFAHGQFTYDDTARVPLVIASPGRVPAGMVHDDIVQIAALAPTALQALGLAAPPSMELPGFWGLATRAGRTPGGDDASEAFIEANTVPSALRRAVRSGRWKLIENPTGFDRAPGRFDLRSVLSMNRKKKALELVLTRHEFLSRHELYDMAADPGEMNNLAGRQPVVEERLRTRLQAWRATGKARVRLLPTSTQELPEDILQNLKSLGYVQ